MKKIQINFLSTVLFLFISINLCEAAWWNTDWAQRLPLSASADGSAHIDKPAQVEVNFTEAFEALGNSSTASCGMSSFLARNEGTEIGTTFSR